MSGRSDLSTTVKIPTVSVIIPTLNEARNLPHVFKNLPADAEIVLVDGRSTDDTVAVAQSLRPDIIIVNQTRRGKGNALACGFAAASGDIIVMLDADGSADPAEIGEFVRALTAGADFAKGSRFINGGGSNDITRMRRAGNSFLSGLVNIFLDCRYSDLCYGYNAFWRHCLPALSLDPGNHSDTYEWGDGFEVETVINMRVARAGLRVVEVPSFEHPRIHGVSNLNAFSDGLRVLRTILVESRGSRGRRRRLVPRWSTAAAVGPNLTVLRPQQARGETPEGVRLEVSEADAGVGAMGTVGAVGSEAECA
ncbi:MULTISPECIES: glycosyltransferase family 2 protein [Protofrankia]|uniref:Glycosyl transferase family 2 n=1 Tax=Candidatus Protofrankia datiscae TaxID=2716812 RepID=F8AWD5_9ACTN|nr:MULTISPECIES: glycosyltransferase family 2 protein [Protofrankia]AEH08336.1 glycosyl transferase family 2 [Candidatus Protofrankia datiscae]